jgi:hypothetical protein
MTVNGVADTVVLSELKVWTAGGGDSDDEPLHVELTGRAQRQRRRVLLRINLHDINNVLGVLLSASVP